MNIDRCSIPPKVCLNDKKVEMRRGIIQFENLTVVHVVQYLFNILKDVFISVNENKKKIEKLCIFDYR